MSLSTLSSGGVIEGHVSLIANCDAVNEVDDDDYGQFVGHHSDEFLAREEIEVNNNNVKIEGTNDDSSEAQVFNTLLAAVSIIIISLLVNQSEEIQNFVKGWLSRS